MLMTQRIVITLILSLCAYNVVEASVATSSQTLVGSRETLPLLESAYSAPCARCDPLTLNEPSQSPPDRNETLVTDLYGTSRVGAGDFIYWPIENTTNPIYKPRRRSALTSIIELGSSADEEGARVATQELTREKLKRQRTSGIELWKRGSGRNTKGKGNGKGKNKNKPKRPKNPNPKQSESASASAPKRTPSRVSLNEFLQYEGFDEDYRENVNVWYVRTATLQKRDETEKYLDLEVAMLREQGRGSRNRGTGNQQITKAEQRQHGRKNSNQSYVYEWKKWPAERSGSTGPELPADLEKFNRGLVWVPQRIVPTFMFTFFIQLFECCNEPRSDDRKADEDARSYFYLCAKANRRNELFEAFNDIHNNAFGTDQNTGRLYEAALEGHYYRLDVAGQNRVLMFYVKKLLEQTRTQYMNTVKRIALARDNEISINPDIPSRFGNAWVKHMEAVHARALFIIESTLGAKSTLNQEQRNLIDWVILEEREAWTNLEAKKQTDQLSLRPVSPGQEPPAPSSSS